MKHRILEEALTDAWLAGYRASGEGNNGEYPYEGNVKEIRTVLGKEARAWAVRKTRRLI